MIMNAAFLVSARPGAARSTPQSSRSRSRFDKLTFKYTGPVAAVQLREHPAEAGRAKPVQRLSRSMFILDSLLIGGLRFVLDKVVAAAEAETAGRHGAARAAARGADAARARRDHRRRSSPRSSATILARIREIKGAQQGAFTMSPQRQDHRRGQSRASSRRPLAARVQSSSAARAASARRPAPPRDAVGAARAGRRVLAVSTDPAHSLGDALGVQAVVAGPASDPRRRPRAARGGARRAAGVRALADATTAARSADIIEHGTWLDRHDVDALLELAVPGIDELSACSRSCASRRAPGFDVVVVDTAPTGHTLRLLAAPEAVAAAGQRARRAAARSPDRPRSARARRPARGGRSADRGARAAGDETRASCSCAIARRTAFHWVTLAEEMSLSPKRRTRVAALDDARRDRCDEIVVNRVTAARAALRDLRSRGGDAERTSHRRDPRGSRVGRPRRV